MANLPPVQGEQSGGLADWLGMSSQYNAQAAPASLYDWKGEGQNYYEGQAKDYGNRDSAKLSLDQYGNYAAGENYLQGNGMADQQRRQTSLEDQLNDIAQGKGDSAAQQQMKLGGDQALANQLAAARGARGPGQGTAGYNAAQTGAAAQAQVVGQAGVLRAQEAAQARGELGNVLQQQQAANLQAAAQQQQLDMYQAGLQQQQNQQNLQGALGFNSLGLQSSEAQAQQGIAQGQNYMQAQGINAGTSNANAQAMGSLIGGGASGAGAAIGALALAADGGAIHSDINAKQGIQPAGNNQPMQSAAPYSQAAPNYPVSMGGPPMGSPGQRMNGQAAPNVGQGFITPYMGMAGVQGPGPALTAPVGPNGVPATNPNIVASRQMATARSAVGGASPPSGPSPVATQMGQQYDASRGRTMMSDPHTKEMISPAGANSTELENLRHTVSSDTFSMPKLDGSNAGGQGIAQGFSNFSSEQKKGKEKKINNIGSDSWASGDTTPQPYSGGGMSSDEAATALGFKAEGADTHKGQPYLVGEQGPELIVPDEPGWVLTAQQTAALAGAPPTNQQEEMLQLRGQLTDTRRREKGGGVQYLGTSMGDTVLWDQDRGKVGEAILGTNPNPAGASLSSPAPKYSSAPPPAAVEPESKPEGEAKKKKERELTPEEMSKMADQLIAQTKAQTAASLAMGPAVQPALDRGQPAPWLTNYMNQQAAVQPREGGGEVRDEGEIEDPPMFSREWLEQKIARAMDVDQGKRDDRAKKFEAGKEKVQKAINDKVAPIADKEKGAVGLKAPAETAQEKKIREQQYLIDALNHQKDLIDLQNLRKRVDAQQTVSVPVVTRPVPGNDPSRPQLPPPAPAPVPAPASAAAPPGWDPNRGPAPAQMQPRAAGGHVGGETTSDKFLDALSRSQSTYTYKDPHNEPTDTPTGGHYLGVMAQAVEQTPTGHTLVKDGPKGKYLEMGPSLSAALAGLGRLNERLDALEDGLPKRKKGKK